LFRKKITVFKKITKQFSRHFSIYSFNTIFSTRKFTIYPINPSKQIQAQLVTFQKDAKVFTNQYQFQKESVQAQQIKSEAKTKLKKKVIFPKV
jgi:hypothetical protein